MIAAIITGPSYAEAKEQMQVDADLYELRLDYFDFHDLTQIASLLTKPCILKGSAELADLKPAYIDLESTHSKKISAPLILSYHNFEETPDLEALWENMTKTPATYYKIACMAHSSLDSWRMLEFVKTHPNCIGISLGEKGAFTRILGPIFGSPIAYAPVAKSTAPGQIPFEELKKYCLKPHAKLFGVIGFPLNTTRSPPYHNQKYREMGIDAAYVKMPFQAEELPSFLPYMKNFSGLSVTMPLKEAILPYLDEIDEEAKAIGAVNTLTLEKGRITGYNTDGKGALDAIEDTTPVKGKNLTVLGAGGAARAIIYEAKKRGAHVSIVNRTFEKAQKLAREFNVTALQKVEPYDILVNTTPADAYLDEIIQNSIVMDIRTQLTPFLAAAAQKNCTLIYGEEMFNYQALEQIKLWKLERE